MIFEARVGGGFEEAKKGEAIDLEDTDQGARVRY